LYGWFALKCIVQLHSANRIFIGHSGLLNAEVDRILIGLVAESRWTPVVVLGDAGGRFVLLLWLEGKAPHADNSAACNQRDRARPA
jgi:hypothetical protein